MISRVRYITHKHTTVKKLVVRISLISDQVTKNSVTCLTRSCTQLVGIKLVHKLVDIKLECLQTRLQIVVGNRHLSRTLARRPAAGLCFRHAAHATTQMHYTPGQNGALCTI